MSDTCQFYYPNYYHMLRITGLWPDDQTFFKKIQRTIYVTLVVCTIMFQASTLRYADITMKSLIHMLSYASSILLTMLRYIGIIIYFPIYKELFDSMERDRNAIEDPVEMELVLNHVTQTRNVITALKALVYAAVVVLTTFFILVPAIFLPQSQIRYLRLLGFFYREISTETTMIAIYLVFFSMAILVVIICTELLLAVMSSYFCGLFEIVSYRLETTVNKMAESRYQNGLIDIRSPVELHQHVLELTALFMEGVTLPYLMTIPVVIGSFSLSIYRLYLSFMALEDVVNILISLIIFLGHVLIIFLNNHSGQKLMNSSIEIFIKTYNALWYRIPPKSQEMLLFVLMKTITEVQFNLAGLFNPCFTGFATMMSSSFSYFTALLSF